MKIGLIPIDNRPVCYTLPKLIAGINSDIELVMPPRELLGDLTKPARKEILFEILNSWKGFDSIIISLDTLVWGGLIPSRRSSTPLAEILALLENLKVILKEKDCPIYAFSSIMRISNNNINEEEKEYWDMWGKKIFEYSYIADKTGFPPKTDIPKEILKDYLNTRKRNFEINKIYLEWQKEGIFDTLVFSKDDCAQFGLNVQEARKLKAEGGFVKTGADEIPLSLLSRAITKNLTSVYSGIPNRPENYNPDGIRIFPIFTEPEYKHLISNYEDISIEESVRSQIELAGCKVSNNYSDSDIVLIVNNFKNNQGEIVMKIPTEPFKGEINLPDKPFMIADVRFANGADNSFVEKLLENLNFNSDNFLGYSGWNTSANSLGSLIAGGLVKFTDNDYNKTEFLKLQLTRLLDDWGYQANVRQKLDIPDESLLVEKMKKYESILGCVNSVRYSFPWHRLFEVEIEFI